MTRTQKSDPHEDIRKLAEAEWLRKSLPDSANGGSIIMDVPFAALRVEKQGVWSHNDCKALGHCDLVLTDGSMVRNTNNCQGRGWIPEPDVEKACGRLTYWLAERGYVLVYTPRGTWAVGDEGRQDGRIIAEAHTPNEAVIRAAEAWLEEQHG